MSTQASPATQPRAAAGKYLGFTLGEETYAIEVGYVREIIGALPITRVPGLPESLRGVINLRGRIIPVADLRLRFNLAAVDHGHRTCIIVVSARGTDFGFVVDRVVEVMHITEDQIDAPPEFGVSVQPEYLLGIARCAGRVQLLLDLERTLSVTERTALAAAASES